MNILYMTFFSSKQHTMAGNVLIFHSKEAKVKKKKKKEYFIDYLLRQQGKLWVLNISCEDCTLMNIIHS